MSHANKDYILYVRIYGLPPEVADRELASVLGKYSKVKRIVCEKIPVELCLNAYTGVRGADIRVGNHDHFFSTGLLWIHLGPQTAGENLGTIGCNPAFRIVF